MTDMVLVLLHPKKTFTELDMQKSLKSLNFSKRTGLKLEKNSTSQIQQATETLNEVAVIRSATELNTVLTRSSKTVLMVSGVNSEHSDNVLSVFKQRAKH